MLSCKEVTYLLSEAQDRPLGVTERMRLEMHLMMCKGCRNFRDQVDFIGKACRRFLDPDENRPER